MGAIENEVDLNLIKRFEQLKNIKFPRNILMYEILQWRDPEFLDYWGRWQSAVIDVEIIHIGQFVFWN